MLKTRSSHEIPQSSQHKLQITEELLDSVLYGRQKVERVDVQGKMERSSRKRKGDFQDQEYSRKIQSLWCEECCKHIQGECPIHSTSPKLTYAIRSFPAEVQLCTSSIPGYKYGACAARRIPSGTWIGPYEGKRVHACKPTENKDNAYIWEIYENGKLSHFVDGSDENISSWMRFIRCARNKNEQSMTVFQYGKNIYYRALRDIAVGEEMLVWYDPIYTQFLGIPIALQHEFGEGQESTTQDHSVVAQHSGLPGYHGLPQISQTKKSPLYPPSQRPPTQPPLQVPSASEAPTPLSKEMDQRPAYGQLPHVQPSYVRPPYGQPTPHVRPPQVRPMYHVPRSLQAPTPFQLPSPSTVSVPHHVRSPFTMTPPSSQAPTVSQGTPKAHVSPFSMIPYPPRARPESHGTPFQIPQVPPIPLPSSPPQLFPVHSSPGTAPAKGFYRAATDQHERGPIPSNPVSSPPTQLSPVHSSPGAATAKGFYRATTDQHDRGLFEVTTTKTLSPDNQWSSVEVKENMPVNTTEVQLKTPINSQLSMKSSPLQNLSSSIHNTTKSGSEEKRHNQVSSTVEANEEQQISWKCGQCGENFSQRLTLQMHVCSKAPENPFQCGHCSLAFANPCELREHVITHSNDRPFKCGFCGRSFAGATTLNNHMRTHTGEKPFACEACGKTFAIATQLSRHMKLPGIDCAKHYHQKDAQWFHQNTPIAVE